MNILITGAGKGIGFYLVKKMLSLVKPNDKIFAVSRNINNIQELKNEDSHNNLVIIKADITNQDHINTIIQTISSNCNGLNFLINNAAQLLNKSFLQIEFEEMDRVMKTNFYAPFMLTQKLFKLLSNTESSHIVNISSMGAIQGAAKFPGLSVYSSSKAALACLTECLAEEFKDTNIKVNALCLGAVNTEMLREAFPQYTAQINPEEIVEFISDFAFNAAKVMNGKLIQVALSTP